jgi:DNA invertase Pin-like site-specific DNA recombinase
MTQKLLIGLAAIDFVFVIYLLILYRRIAKQTKAITPQVLPRKKRGGYNTVGKKLKEEPKRTTVRKKKKVYLTREQGEELKRLFSLGRTKTSLAKEFNISHSYACRVCNKSNLKFKGEN